MNFYYFWKHNRTSEEVKGFITFLSDEQLREDELKMMIEMCAAGWSFVKKECSPVARKVKNEK